MKPMTLIVLLFACATAARGQSPQSTPQKQPPAPQPPAPQQPPPPVQAPAPQLYRLVPVEAPPPQPVQYVTAPAPQVQYVQAPAPQPVAVQQYGFTTTSTGQRTVTLGPGPLSLCASWVGQRLVGLGKTHVFTINHQIIRPVNPQPAPPVQTTTYMVSVPQPVVQQPVQVQLVAQPVAQPQQPVQLYRSEEAPPPPAIPKPSPQSAAEAGHRIMSLFGH